MGPRSAGEVPPESYGRLVGRTSGPRAPEPARPRSRPRLARRQAAREAVPATSWLQSGRRQSWLFAGCGTSLGRAERRMRYPRPENRRPCRGSARRWSAVRPYGGLASVIIKTLTFLLWLASRPSDTRNIQTPIWFPRRCILCLKVVMLSRRLLQRRYEPHHIVDVPLALRALPPLSQGQFAANRSILRRRPLAGRQRTVGRSTSA